MSIILTLSCRDSQQMADHSVDISEHDYRQVRERLVTFFRMGGCFDPEALADEVVYRTLRRIADGVHLNCELASFCLGIARNVLREWRKKHQFQELTHDPSDSPGRGFANMNRTELGLWLQDCLRALPEEKRSVLLEYHMGDRRELAQKRDKSPNALRIEIYRLTQEILQSVQSRTQKGRTQ